MLEIAKRTTCGALILLIMPLAVWVSGWQWQPGSDGHLLKVLFWMTETVTSPWGILTSVIFSAWFLWCLRFRLKPAIGLVLMLSAALLIGQGVKSYIKGQVQEPRPFVLWLEKTYSIDDSQFYQLSRKQRGEMVGRQLQNDRQIPLWLRQHWQFETGFAFPSGHTLFAASWALLGVGLLWPRRHFKTVMVLMVWATAVMGSRLVLGMHWPRDLVVATLISWLLITLACWLVQRWIGPLTIPPEENKEIIERERQ